MVPKSLYVPAALFCVIATAAFGQSRIDRETLAKGEALWAKAKAAPAAQRPALLQTFGALVQTEGLSKPCRTALVSMQSAAASAVPDEALDDMPDAMKATLKAQGAEAEGKIAAERAACLAPARAETAPPAKPVAATRPAPEAAEMGEASVPIQERLAKIQAASKAAFEAKDRSALDRLNTTLGVLAKQQEHDMSCRLAATNMMREIKHYHQSIDATDPDMQKIASAGIRLASSAAKRNLDDCE